MAGLLVQSQSVFYCRLKAGEGGGNEEESLQARPVPGDCHPVCRLTLLSVPIGRDLNANEMVQVSICRTCMYAGLGRSVI